MRTTTIIADSGSTKTDWHIESDGFCGTLRTSGMNPAVQSREEITRVVCGELRLAMPQPLQDETAYSATGESAYIHYYGAGCTEKGITLITETLHEAFGKEARIEAHSDMLGAARALLGDREGIACILGTGSNSCLYDGHKIIRQTPALGYILGDEGSGAVLGRLFLNALFKGRLPREVAGEFLRESGHSMQDIIDNVYRRQAPNRYLASMSPFIARHIGCPEIEEIVTGNFRLFIEWNIAPYRRRLPINAIGGVAATYERQLRKAAAETGFAVGEVRRSPLEGLVAYHKASG